MLTKSRFLHRRLTCGNKPLMIRSLPENWPLRTGKRFVLDKPVLLDPNKQYRVAIDYDAGTVEIREDA